MDWARVGEIGSRLRGGSLLPQRACHKHRGSHDDGSRDTQVAIHHTTSVRTIFVARDPPYLYSSGATSLTSGPGLTVGETGAFALLTVGRVPFALAVASWRRGRVTVWDDRGHLASVPHGMAIKFQSSDDISWGLSDSAKRNHDRRMVMVDLWVLTSNDGKTGREKVLEVVGKLPEY